MKKTYDLTNKGAHQANLGAIMCNYYQQEEEWIEGLVKDGVKAHHTGNGLLEPNTVHGGWIHFIGGHKFSDIEIGDKVALGLHGDFRLVTITGVHLKSFLPYLQFKEE